MQVVEDIEDLRESLENVLGPIPEQATLMDGRLMNFERRTLLCAGKAIWYALGATRCVVKAQVGAGSDGEAASRGASSRQEVFEVEIDNRCVTLEFEMPFSVSGSPMLYCKSMSDVVEALLTIARSATWGLFQTEGPGLTAESVGLGYEVMTSAIVRACETRFLRGSIAPDKPDLLKFLLAYSPYTAEHAIVDTAIAWLDEIRATTFEGQALRTGVCFDLREGPPSLGTRVCFQQRTRWEKFRHNRQHLALGDGLTRFIRVDQDQTVSDMCVIPNEIFKQLLEEQRPDVESLHHPDRLWLQATDHSRIRVYTDVGGRFHHVGTVVRGRLRINDLRSLVECGVAIVEAVTEDVHSDRIRDFVVGLVTRGQSGHGGGVIVGGLPSSETIPKDKRIEPLELDGSSGFQFLMDPDGAVIIDRKLRAIAIGHFVGTVGTGETGTGTRHSALMHVTSCGECVAIAVSDDGSVTFFADGKRVLQIE